MARQDRTLIVHGAGSASRRERNGDSGPKFHGLKLLSS